MGIEEEPFPMEQLTPDVESGTESPGSISERVTEHSREFDKEIAKDWAYSPESMVRQAWQVREWRIGETAVKAIGVEHTPETFLEFREEIERAIQESDIVVNEFAPEALGLYDETAAPRLKSIRSKINGRYNLEDLRQAYLKYERPWNLGLFHHEVELLAAKYGKDMATMDLAFSKDLESLLQDEDIYIEGAEQVEENKAALKRVGLYTGAAALGVAALRGLIGRSEKPMSRRRFLRLGLMAAGAAAIAGATPKIIETPPRTAEKKEAQESVDDFEALQSLRDVKIADSLQQLAKSGYKKIVIIYGTAHLEKIKEYLNDPEYVAGIVSQPINRDVIKRNNPDSLRVYRLSPGENTSERFVASKRMVWKRIRD